MMAYANIAVALLAAGQGERFGGDKLSADLGGVQLGLRAVHMLSDMGFGWQFAICGASFTGSLKEAGFDPIINDQPQLGQSHSLHLAIAAAEQTSAEALLVCLADMPLIYAGHITAIIQESKSRDGIIASSNGTTAMPPALFPRSYWPALLETTGDAGARGFLKDAAQIYAPPETLIDIDTREDLAAACASL
jgi:molybdenum cofactor cytidylyltransferase